MSNQQERTNEAVAKLNNPFATDARADKVAKLISAVNGAADPKAIFDELIDHNLDESQWYMLDTIAGLRHPSSEVTREAVRQVVIFMAMQDQPDDRLRTRFVDRVRSFLK